MNKPELSQEEIHHAVRDAYGRIARGEVSSCCGPSSGGSPCGPGPEASAKLGYSAEEMGSVPQGANLGLGCGNPGAIASLAEGETVLDLGAGAGFDCFLAARQVGPSGRVIGVDMTPDMVEKARFNAEKVGAANVEFRLGEIERLPVSDAAVDVIVSNCVINLSPDKEAVFKEAFRVLRPGGRLAISDVVLLDALPKELEGDVAALTGCVAGAATQSRLREILESVGFTEVRVETSAKLRDAVAGWMPGSGVENYIASAMIVGVRPKSDACCAPTCCDGKSPS